jgi:putative ABC transport system permease protein
VLRKDENNIVANASVMQYNEITSENVASFHFHGDPDSFPVTAAIALPKDEKSSALLQGRYLGNDELVQIVQPESVMQELLRTVMTVQRYVMLAAIVIGVATLATMSLVFMLSIQLRKGEIETMIKIGGSRQRILSLIAAEILGVLAAGIVLAGGLSIATIWLASSVTRLLIQVT